MVKLRYNLRKEYAAMSKRKKILIILTSIFTALIILCAAVIAWQWTNIEAFRLARKYSSDEILNQMSENDGNLKNEVEKYFTGDIRDFTEEEKELINSGKISEKQMIAKIISEEMGGATEETAQIYNKISEDQKKVDADVKITFDSSEVLVPVSVKEKNEDKKTLVVVGKPVTASPAQNHTPAVTADSIISKYVSQLYVLESKYIGAIEGVVASAKAEAKAQGLTKKDTSKLLAIGANYTGTINSLEAKCDGEVEAIITNLRNELNAINADTSIIDTIKSAYASEKSLKRAYYMNMIGL